MRHRLAKRVSLGVSLHEASGVVEGLQQHNHKTSYVQTHMQERLGRSFSPPGD